MKPVATLILNRNLPDVTDALWEKLDRQNRDLSDLYVIESGSEESKRSKHSTWWANWPEALEQGLRYPRGFNYGLSKLLEENRYDSYEYFFLLCNDTVFSEGPILLPLLEEMSHHPRLGILSPCSPSWGESRLIPPGETRYFWYISPNAWLVRRAYVDCIREKESPSYMNFFYDGTNFRGYGADVELAAKAYINDWAAGVTSRLFVEENKDLLLTKADLIRTEPYHESLVKCLEEGKQWMRRKYGFHSFWNMQMYAKYYYDKYFEYFPEDFRYKI